MEDLKVLEQGINLTAEDLDTPDAKNVAPEVIKNDMNEVLHRSILEKYIDPAFFEAVPDILALTPDQLELEHKEKIDIEELVEDIGQEGDSAPNTADKNIAALTPRAYQYELFQKALQQNIIAVLQTGSGKTLIAVMLIKQMSLIEKMERLKRVEVKKSVITIITIFYYLLLYLIYINICISTL